MNRATTILAIESSCDETSAAICRNGEILSNSIANQTVHEQYGGVVPELASRAHMQNIVPVVTSALQTAGCTTAQLDAIAFTQSPGLIGSLLVGVQFAKSLALALNKPLIAVHHMQAHVLANLIPVVKEGRTLPRPSFPFLCLTVSGGHTQIVLAEAPERLTVLGETIDDAAGEAFDKTAKLLGLPYPGGPLIDKHAQQGDPLQYKFAEPRISGLDFSFSGLKTSVLYFLQAETKKNPLFIQQNLSSLAASIQYTIVKILLEKLQKAVQQTGITQVCLAGGVSANSGLRNAFTTLGEKLSWQTFIPPFQYCTDNAAMIAITAYYKFLNNDFAELDATPAARAAW